MALEIRCYSVGPLENNTYVIRPDSEETVIVVDPGLGSETVLETVLNSGYRITAVINTHAHLDHISQNRAFIEAHGALLMLHPDDGPLMQTMPAQAAWMNVPLPDLPEPSVGLCDGMVLPVGTDSLTVIHTPGHSPGHISLLGPGWAIVGDVLFAGSVGRTDLPGGDHDILLRSIRERLLTLPDDTVVYPGHGPATTVGRERRLNPYLIHGEVS